MFTRLLTDWREMLGEQVTFRELLYQMAMRDLRIRYKQSVMGFGWAVFMPLVNTAVFSVIFLRVARIETPVPYPVFAYCGLVAWNYFASSLRFSVISLTGNTSLVTKVYFPREIFPFSCILVATMDFLVANLVLIALMTYYRIAPTTAVFFLPVIVLVQVTFTAGIALLLSMGNLYLRDVKYLFEIIVTVWMFATSVVYPVHLVGGRLQYVLMLNPMTPIVDAYRSVLLLGRLPEPVPFASAAALSAVVLLFSWTLFHRGEFKFAETI